MKNWIKISWILAAILFSACYSCKNYSVSENQAESFLKYYPLDIEDNEGKEILQTPNGDYVILTNYIQEGGTGSDKDILLIFCDEFGRKSNNSPVYIGTDGFDRGNSIIQLGNDFIIAGSSKIGSQKFGFLSRIGNDGRVIWQHNYGGYPEMEFNEVMQHQDGGYIMTGYAVDINGEKDVILFKTNADGDSLWTTTEGYSGYDDVGESLERFQERLLIIGTSSHVNASEYSRLLILNSKLDGRGIIPKRISGDVDLYGKEIVLDPSGDVYVMGNERNPLSSDSRIYLAKIDLIGSGLEEVIITDYNYLEDLNPIWGEDLESTEAGGIAICGWESLQNDFNIYFTNVDNNLQVIYKQTYGSKGYQVTQGLFHTNDLGFALTGSIDLGGARTTILLKLDSEGILQ